MLVWALVNAMLEKGLEGLEEKKEPKHSVGLTKRTGLFHCKGEDEKYLDGEERLRKKLEKKTRKRNKACTRKPEGKRCARHKDQVERLEAEWEAKFETRHKNSPPHQKAKHEPPDPVDPPIEKIDDDGVFTATKRERAVDGPELLQNTLAALKKRVEERGYKDASLNIKLDSAFKTSAADSDSADALQKSNPKLDGSHASILHMDHSTGIAKIDQIEGFASGYLTGYFEDALGDPIMPKVDETPCWRANGSLFGVDALGGDVKLADWRLDFGSQCTPAAQGGYSVAAIGGGATLGGLRGIGGAGGWMAL